MAVQIRSLDPGEVAGLTEELVALAVRSKASWGYDASFLAAFERVMADDLAELVRQIAEAALAGVRPASVVIVAEKPGRPGIVGFAQVRDEKHRAWLEDLWVDRDSLRRGIGRLLWRAAVEAANGMDRAVLELESDPNAEPFYSRMGARRTGQRASTIEDGRLLPLMRINLRNSPAAS